MLQVRGGSPDGRVPRDSSPEDSYNSYDSEYESDFEHFPNRPGKRKFDREHKNRRNRDGTKRERKNFKEKQRAAKELQREQPRVPIEDGKSICMFYMQGKCHKVSWANDD